MILWLKFKLVNSVLGQLPTEDNSPPDKNKAQLLPTGTRIPRTTDYCPPDQYQQVKPLIRTNIYMVGNCPGGELSEYVSQDMSYVALAACGF